MKTKLFYALGFQKYLRKKTDKRTVQLSILVLVILGFFIPLIALIVSIVLTYRLLTLLLSHKVFDSKLFILAVSIFFYMLILQALIMISWLFSNNFPLTLCGPLVPLILLCLHYLLKPTIHKNDAKAKSKFTAGKIYDIVPIVVCLLSFMAFVAFPIHHSGNKDISAATVLINRVIDDPNHLGLLNDRLQFNRGVILNSTAEGHTNTKGASFYPAGWHSANAVVIKAFYPDISTGAESLVAYAVTKVFWFLFLVYVFVRTIFSLYVLYSKEKLPSVTSVWIGLASLLFVGWFLIDPFLDGFYSFLPQLIIVPIFILSLIQMSLLNKNDESKFLNSLILPALLCMGSALSWLLLLPVFAGAFILYSLTLLHTWGIINTFKSISNKLLRYIPILLLVLAPVVVQVLTSGSTGESVSFIQGIMLPGPIQTYPSSFYNFIFLGLGIFIVLAMREKRPDRLQPIFCYLLVILAFTATLYLLQLYTSQANFYYYFKSLNAFTIAASIMCITGYASFISWIQAKTSRFTAGAACFILILIAVQFVYTKPLLFLYIEGSRATSVTTDKQIFNILSERYTQDNYTNKEITIYYPSNNPNLNEVGSRLLSTNKPFSACYDYVKGASFSIKPKDFSTSPILKHCSDPEIKITYYVEKSFLASMQEKINDDNLTKKVTLRTID